MKPRSAFLTLVAATAMLVAGCATEPTTETGKANLDQSVDRVMAKLQDRDPGMKDFLGNSYAYVVFPTVGTGGAVVGGSYGRGEVFMGGKMIGYADITQLTAGADQQRDIHRDYRVREPGRAESVQGQQAVVRNNRISRPPQVGGCEKRNI